MIQPAGDVIAAEGDTVTLNCSFSVTSSTNGYLFWYKQEENDRPTYILRRDTIGTVDNAPEFNKDRFDAELNKEKSEVHLQISSAAVSDSAVYYCAVRPTVTGNS